MPTKNPKISAYVPHVVYDRFQQFQEERNISSMSQAVIELLVEYFDIDLSQNSTKEYTGGLPQRITQLEQVVADLKQSYIYLAQKVDFSQSTSGLLAIGSDDNSVNLQSRLQSNLLNDESTSELLNELPIESVSNSLSGLKNELPYTKPLTEQVNSSLQGEPISKLSNLLPHQLEIVESESHEDSSLLSDISSELDIRIDYPALAIRLGSTEGSIRNKRSVSTTYQFTEWITKKDPDKITWHPIKEGRKVYYSPSQDLTDEQKLNLQKWLGDNQITVDSP